MSQNKSSEFYQSFQTKCNALNSRKTEDFRKDDLKQAVAREISLTLENEWDKNRVILDAGLAALMATEAVAQRCSVKKVVFRNFSKFTGKHLCQSLFLNKVEGLRPNKYLSNNRQVFIRELCDFLIL